MNKFLLNAHLPTIKFAKMWQDYLEEHCKCSDGTGSLLNHPFFQNNFYLDFKVDGNYIHEFWGDYWEKFPIELRILYSNIAADIQVEFDSTHWLFLSPKEVYNSMEFHSEYVDVAIDHLGMGHVALLSYYWKFGKYFYRKDGGSNWYDRLENQIEARNYIPTDEELMDWSQVNNYFMELRKN